MTCRPGLAPVAALALLVSFGSARAQSPERGDLAWQPMPDLVGGAAGPDLALPPLAGCDGLLLDSDLPGVRALLDGALAQRGFPDGERNAQLDALMPSLRALLGSASVVGIGPLEMTRAEVAAVAGPRAGRDRAQVVARLRARVPGASALSDEEATALVPDIARKADAHDADRILQRVVAQILGSGAVQ